MKSAALALALCALAAAPAHAGGKGRGAVYLVASDGYASWHKGPRLHRTAIEDGYFAHGRLGRGGRFDYDRGYPYDYYPSYEEQVAEKDWAEYEEPVSSGRGCERQWVRDGRSGKAEVRVCRD